MAECTIYDKLRYIQETKDLIKAAIESQDIEVLESDTFRKYAEYITEIRKVSSVNGMQGDVTITIQDLGGITQDELDEAISSVEGNANVIELTQSEYDELERNGQLEDSLYLITDVVSDYITQDELSIQLQDKVSETALNEAIEGVRNEIPNTDSFVREDNLKTINGESIVGEGDIQIEGGEGNANVIELTQSEYDELKANNQLEDALYLLTDVDIPEGGGNANIIELTQAEYDELKENNQLEEKTLYVITDAEEIELNNYVTRDELNEIIGSINYKITEINNLI